LRKVISGQILAKISLLSKLHSRKLASLGVVRFPVSILPRQLSRQGFIIRAGLIK